MRDLNSAEAISQSIYTRVLTLLAPYNPYTFGNPCENLHGRINWESHCDTTLHNPIHITGP